MAGLVELVYMHFYMSYVIDCCSCFGFNFDHYLLFLFSLSFCHACDTILIRTPDITWHISDQSGWYITPQLAVYACLKPFVRCDFRNWVSYHKTTAGACIAIFILPLWVQTKFEQDNKNLCLCQVAVKFRILSPAHPSKQGRNWWSCK